MLQLTYKTSGSNGVFRRDCALVWRLAVWWGGEGLLGRKRTHGCRWEAVGQRGPHGGRVAGMRSRSKRRSTGRETRREHHPWRRRGPHRHHGRAPGSPGRIEIRRWWTIGGSTRKGTIHGAHRAHWGCAPHPWISLRGSPSISRTRLSAFLFTRPKAVFSV